MRPAIWGLASAYCRAAQSTPVQHMVQAYSVCRALSMAPLLQHLPPAHRAAAAAAVAADTDTGWRPSQEPSPACCTDCSPPPCPGALPPRPQRLPSPAQQQQACTAQGAPCCAAAGWASRCGGLGRCTARPSSAPQPAMVRISRERAAAAPMRSARVLRCGRMYAATLLACWHTCSLTVTRLRAPH